MFDRVGPGGRCRRTRDLIRACHLVDDTGAKQPTVSHHLRALREAGLVVAEPHGRFTYYRLLPDAFASAGQRLADLADRARANAHTRREC